MTTSYTSQAAVPPGQPRAGGLQMLVIDHESRLPGVFDQTITALFNPTKLSTSTSVEWTPQPTIQPTGALPRLAPPTAPSPTTLTLELFFDTALRRPGGGALARAGAGLMATAASLVGLAGQPSGTNVLALTAKVFALTQIAQELHRPPLCRLWWGQNFILCGALTSLGQEFERFHANGTPIRARLACTFTEHQDPASTPTELHSPDVLRTHQVTRGDTLTRLAATYYDDPSAWREIARANQLSNPRDLTPGRVLLIPKLR